MPEENLNLEWNIWTNNSHVEAIPTENSPVNVVSNTGDVNLVQNVNNQVDNLDSLKSVQVDNLDINSMAWSTTLNNLEINNTVWNPVNLVENVNVSSSNDLYFENTASSTTQIDNSVFLDSWDDSNTKTSSQEDSEGIWKNIRLFFLACFISIIWIIVILWLFSFEKFITQASQSTIDENYVEYVSKYKDNLWKIKRWFWLYNVDNYSSPRLWDKDIKQEVNEIINSVDIDYIEKKDLLSPFISELIRDSESKANQVETTKQEIAKQWFLPEELNQILSEEQAIDTIQRSLNALEVIKFSTATKVFSYLDSALVTISEMVRVSWSSIETISKLLNQLSLRWEKDISAYVYMCYLNPFETNVNCDTIWDLDLYYNSIIKDDSLNVRLFKNVMNAINQILEKEDTSLFSITFNGFNAQDKDITFSIEVYTNQNDERSLIAKWKKNPNIFILTNIINLLKQSSFIIGANINTKEVNVDIKTITLGWISTKVNYSNMDFTVPIQKATEREIFDYIDLDNIQKLLNSLKNSWGETDNLQDNKTGESTMESEMTETELTQTDNTDASSTGDVQENEPILESTGVIDEFSLDETNESEKIDNSEINVKNENENISPELSQDKEYWQNLTENENTENNNEMKTDLNLED